MSWRSRWWWAAALIVSSAGAARLLFLDHSFFGPMDIPAVCPGWDAYMTAGPVLGEVLVRVPPLWFAGLPGLVLAFLTHLVSLRLGRPRIGVVVPRAVAALLLAAYGTGPVAFAVDMAVDRTCLDTWGGSLGVAFFLTANVAATLAALCVLAAVRRSSRRAVLG
ncbi:hypothetical protein GCM10009530_09070 [Microbispora corallina]|uniref:Integral membrane protein n=1 Tax=Microbispora corallina TaxID=83302 RepID=A0ABQ4FVL9_9ACTN|nr:hypothetical protein [Microbispora corallina]GIH38870.1 hypothetical protein Mco01_18700 [Microbispora corallina]